MRTKDEIVRKFLEVDSVYPDEQKEQRRQMFLLEVLLDIRDIMNDELQFLKED